MPSPKAQRKARIKMRWAELSAIPALGLRSPPSVISSRFVVTGSGSPGPKGAIREEPSSQPTFAEVYEAADCSGHIGDTCYVMVHDQPMTRDESMLYLSLYFDGFEPCLEEVREVMWEFVEDLSEPLGNHECESVD